jgi:hypothetical protein
MSIEIPQVAHKSGQRLAGDRDTPDLSSLVPGIALHFMTQQKHAAAKWQMFSLGLRAS